MPRTIVWLRRDLRLADHQPLFLAAQRGEVIPLFILDDALLHHPETGAARVQFMLDCLQALDQEFRHLGGRLILRHGDPVQVLPQLVQETEAEGVYAHIDFERIYGRVRDARVNRALAAQGMNIRWFEPPGTTPELLPYVEYRRCWYEQMQQDRRLPIPPRIRVPDGVESLPLPTLAKIGLMPEAKPRPQGGSPAARALLQEFISQKTERYYWQLSYPAANITSGLSPYLKFGVLSTRECFQTVQQHLGNHPDPRVQRSRKQFISRLRWGSGFAQRFRYLPQLELRSLYPVFDADGWEFDPTHYQAWQVGQTGFPIVDAAARCLAVTGGWQALNFRVRAIYASFLSNLLGIDWRYGALHFMRHLLDGDCPIDHYQWAMQAGVTHCLDKTWTRIYNPGQTAVDRCDPEGAFIKRWLPELAHLPPEQLGSPPPVRGYSPPILNYKTARQQRIRKLEAQRFRLRASGIILPELATLPQDLTPFGTERFPTQVSWAQSPDLELFPPPLNLDTLDPEQSRALRTWLVAHVEIQPRQNRPKQTSQKSSRKRQHEGIQQLSLFPQ